MIENLIRLDLLSSSSQSVPPPCIVGLDLIQMWTLSSPPQSTMSLDPGMVSDYNYTTSWVALK